MNFYLAKQNGIQMTDDRFQTRVMEKKTHNIEGFDAHIETAHQIKRDSEDLKVRGIDLVPFVNEENRIQLRVGDRPFYLSEWSLQQLSQKLGVPSVYATKMADAGKRDLFVQNFESWITSHHAGKEYLVRTYNNTVRGFLSDSYFPTDMDLVLPTIREGLQRTNMNFAVQKGIVNPEYANIRFVSDRPVMVGDDPHFTGISISTSDVGRASLKLEFFVYRSACTNGMLFGKHGGELFRKKHTNKNLTEKTYFMAEMDKSLKDLDTLVLTAENMLREATTYKLTDAKMDEIINTYKRFAGVGQATADNITSMVRARMDAYDKVEPTLWSVSNAFTEVAQDFHIDKAEVLENFAGHLLMTRLAV